MKAIQQYFHVVLFIIMLYKVVLTFTSVDETLVCDHTGLNFPLLLPLKMSQKRFLFNLSLDLFQRTTVGSENGYCKRKYKFTIDLMG